MDDAARLKDMAARAALDFVADGMRLGIGSGSTAECFVRALAERVAGGMKIVGVATSERTARLCEELKVPTASLDEMPELDLAIDGADEVDPELRLIKGGGGALLREKIVAAAASRFVVIADASKRVDVLGAFPLPVEVNGFGLTATYLGVRRVAERLGLKGEIRLRQKGAEAFITDNGHLILDASFGRIPNAEALSDALHGVPGVVEHGLFLKLARAAVIAGADGVTTVGQP